MAFDPSFPDIWNACHAAQIAPLVVKYTQGKCLDIGSGPGKVWPRCIGIDPAHQGGRPITDICANGTDLSMFGDESVDGVFSSFLLHQFERSKVVHALREWGRVLKVGGFLTIYVPSAVLGPKKEDEGADPLHRWNIYKHDICTVLDIDTKFGWDLIELEDRDKDKEFGTLTVVRKRADGEWKEDMWRRNPEGKLRALVVRYGAIGDAIVCATIFPLLKAQGYHVTLNTTTRGEEILRHDPNIDEMFLQENDFVPNELLGPYWYALRERYDHIVNLCESVEGLLLALPGRLNHQYCDETRRRLTSHVNYQERTCDIAAVPHDFSGSKFYAAEDEKKWAVALKKRTESPIIIWTVNGSAVHKVWPYTQTVIKWLLEKTPATIILYGDPGPGRKLAEAIMDCLKEDGADMSRIRSIADKWSIRQSLTFAQLADVVIGSETGPLNAVSMEEQVAKVVLMSHSSAENLTKHWVNTQTIETDKTKVPCAPCHRLHLDWEYCVKHEKTGAALCAAHIKPETVFKAIAKALGADVVPPKKKATGLIPPR
jgi:ADP-heptose:LPS heptosyltransferase/predicted SAM-dependent methyltransferase